MSRSNEWDAAHRLAGEIPTCTGPAKHRAISALLAKLLDLLRTGAS
ncbi:hypothetical protein ACCAA_790015 [Candidatus Accumulibacter aalborgensis]|uniref:Transposase n=1 Tax=Candidatus Accumulibacter aalborgensis TaxID=1860102 RepID=A0A1A8Y0I3_9PROT|nr:hypothetical protein [Candidatus Accumulibacter aalborgensis]SBT09838.1 hypothetical protein ACCAA_790015 [Candidatus Accumulibacter aalborgensis]